MEAGTVLAKIDDSLYAAALETAKAQLQQNEANKISAEANVLQMKANLADGSGELESGPEARTVRCARAERLRSVPGQLRGGEGQPRVGESRREPGNGRNRRRPRPTSLTARINLDYCTIKSPVKGVVIDRRVNIGQTVVSSLSAPSLFLIANDLRRIQVWVSVNEADVGNISQGQPVTFTVDAYPGRFFTERSARSASTRR